MNFAEVGILVKPNGSHEQRPPCPRCGSDGGFSVNRVSGMYHCFPCGLKGRAGDHTTVVPIARIDDPAVAERKRERLRRVWRETVDLAHPNAYAVRRYLQSRGLPEVLENPPATLRAHRSLRYWDDITKRELGEFPAMVALFHGANGTPTTLHVTWLRVDGCVKAGVPVPKKILGVAVTGSTRGGSIRLYGPRDGVLGVAEGIESALSLSVLKKIPTWASYCADNLVRIHLPNGIRKLYIGVDIDASGKGEAVAEKLARRVLRWRHHPEVFFVKPDGVGPRDLNDELRRMQN